MIMNQLHRTPECYRILEPMIALAQCSKVQRIIVAGEKSIELMFELERRGYTHVASTANCGQPAEQYQVALIDWLGRRRSTGWSIFCVPTPYSLFGPIVKRRRLARASIKH
jgi:hypothetical protein